MTKKRITSPLSETKYWVEYFVLRHNLCPFAHEPHARGEIRYTVSIAKKLSAVVREFEHEIQLLEEQIAQTTLIIYPDRFQDFNDYLDLVDLLESVLEKIEQAQHYQLASFHPCYQFAETTPEDPANRTNRSPFPMIHILRQQDVTKAIEKFPDTLRIPEQNIKLMRKLFD